MKVAVVQEDKALAVEDGGVVHSVGFSFSTEEDPRARAFADAYLMLDQAFTKLKEETGWLPISTAPKDGTPILGWCVHAADPYWLDGGKRLTIYGGHTEGLSHVQDGPNVVQWGGAFDDSTWEAPGASLPDWWFLYGSEFEVSANPTHWKPIVPGPSGEHA